MHWTYRASGASETEIATPGLLLQLYPAHQERTT